MDAFTFHNPTKFVFGPDAEGKAGAEIRALGLNSVLLVYGQGSVVKSGLLKRVKDSLSEAGIAYQEIGGVMPNPLSGPVYQGIDLVKKHNIQAVLGIGGGSAIDTAKAIALGAKYDGDFWDFFSGKAAPQAALPVITVLTISAAGSESSNSAVITNEELTLKRGVRTAFNKPVLSLMNPKLTYSVPNNQKAYGIADMMAHIFERYFTNTKDVALSDELCEGTLRCIIEAGPKALKDSTDYAAHADLMWAGTLAHDDTLSPGRQQDWSSHGIAHAVSARFSAPHGGVLACIFPQWMRYQMNQDPQRFARFAEKVMGVASNAQDPQAVGEQGIQKLLAFFEDLGLPTKLSAYGVQESDLERLTDEAPFTKDGTIGFFRPLKREDIINVYRMSL